MAHILILGGGAAGLAAALAAAQAAPAARVTVLERNPKAGKKLLATGNGRCNLDNTAIAPEKYFTADPAALRPLLAAVDAAAPLAWFEQLGLYTRTDEAGRVYPYSNQAADVLALLELHLQRHNVQLRTGCTVCTLRQSKGGYAVQFTNAEGGTESLRADAVICAMGGAAGPQFGTDGFGTRFAADCGGQMRPLYPCLTALQCAKPNKSLAGIRAKAAARLLDGDRVLAEEIGEVQFTDYGLFALIRLIQLDLDFAAHKLLKIRGTLELTLGTGRADLKHIAVWDWISLIKDRIEPAAYSLAVVNSDAAVLVDKHPEIPRARLTDILNRPKLAALVLNDGSCQCFDLFRYFTHRKTAFLTIAKCSTKRVGVDPL